MDSREVCDLSLTRLIADKFTLGGGDRGGSARAALSFDESTATRAPFARLDNFDERRRRAPPLRWRRPFSFDDDDDDKENDALHDLEEEFDSVEESSCSHYEIVSTDSPAQLPHRAKRVTGDFAFGSPIDAFGSGETSFGFGTGRKRGAAAQLPPRTDTTRTLDFDDDSLETLRFERWSRKKMRVDSGIVADESLPTFPFPAAEESMFDAPSSLQTLLSGQIHKLETTPTGRDEVAADGRKGFRRCLSLQTSETSAERARASLFAPDAKRRKSCLEGLAETDEEATAALARAYNDGNLIGDFSKSFCLPLESSQHSDLKAISGETLAALIDGEYKETVDSFRVIDCRYPYEYDGGHIVGAENLFTEELVQERLIDAESREIRPNARRIIVFHCEFSFERGPKLCRFLRRADRALNHDTYPSLLHPELYLLRGGYRGFYTQYGHHCRPVSGGYTSMTDPRHAPALKWHRSEASKRTRS